MVTTRQSIFRSLTFRRFLLLLCVAYLFMVLVFHSRLQVDRPIRIDYDIEKVATSSPSTTTANVSNSEFNKSIAGLRRWVSNYYNVKSLAREIDSLEKTVERVRSELIVNTPPRNSEEVYYGKHCIRPAQEVAYNQFHELEKGVYAYSAYLDERKNKRFIRIIMIVAKEKRNKFSLSCEFGDGTQVVSKPYEMCENHNKKFGGYIYSCLVTNGTICPLRIKTAAGRRLVTVPIIPVALNRQHYEYGVCIPPLFGEIKKDILVEFLELSMLLGAEQFYFYNYSISKDMEQVLKHYHDRRLVTMIPWSLPSIITDKMIWYHGQLIAHNDCLYRAMSTMKYMIINDVDEFVIPHGKYTRWKEFVPDLLNDKHCGLAFTSAFYDTSLGIEHPSGLMTMSHMIRSEQYSHVRTKVMVQPQRTFEVGIHHISKQNEEKWTPRKVKPDIAYLHHYRRCVANYGMKCSSTKEDKTILKYFDELRDNFDKSMTFFEASHIKRTSANMTHSNINR